MPHHRGRGWVGEKVTLKLDCRVGKSDRVGGSRHRAGTTVLVKPKRGALGKPSKSGRAVCTARTAGRNVVRHRLRTRSGKRYGGNASTTPFPGGVCQFVSQTRNTGHDDASVQVFGRNRSHDADGVHAPN
jgi:hypothetical protein